MSERIEQPHDPTTYSVFHPLSSSDYYSSASSAPSTRPVSCQSPTYEGDETSSEGFEPLTPTSDTQSHPFHHRDSISDHTMTTKFPDFAPAVEPLNSMGPLEASKLAQFPPPPQTLPTNTNLTHDASNPPTIAVPQHAPSNNASGIPSQPTVQASVTTAKAESRRQSDSDRTPTTATPQRNSSPTKLPPLVPPVSESQAPQAPMAELSQKKLPPMCPPLPQENERQGRPAERIVTATVSNNGRKESPPKEKATAQPPPPSPTSQPKPGLVKRLTNRLTRTNSNNKPSGVGADGSVESKNGSEAESSNGTNGSKKPKFSFSARTSPNTSQSNSPKSPGSRSSSPSHTIQEKSLEPPTDPERKGSFGHNHSRSATGLNNFSRPRQGITWAGSNLTVDGHSRAMSPRRRSASTEQVPKLQEKEEPIVQKIQPTFSTRATEGTGLKARRLSTSLPNEFQVDFCELNKEFKSSSLLPGRRGHLVGKGATATVRLMCQKDGPKDRLFAVKEFRGKDKEEDEQEYISKVKSEYSIAKSLHHPNIVTTIRLCTHSGRWNHVMEYCEYGELFPLVERGLFRTHYKFEDRMCFFKQIIRGVDYLHSHGIAHRDIKLENLLMNAEGHIKISDFGVSEVFSGEHPGLRASGGQCGKNMGAIRRCAPGICGSLPYIAPEVLEKKGDYDPRPLDVWSCAIVFLTMTYSGSPWQAAKPEYEHYAKFKKGWDEWLKTHPDGQITDAPDGAPKCGILFTKLEHGPLKRLLLKMLHPIPEMRISIHDVLNAGVIRGTECCSPESEEEENEAACIDACKGAKQLKAKATVQKKHSHLPPRQHKTPEIFRHRFDMGDGWS